MHRKKIKCVMVLLVSFIFMASSFITVSAYSNYTNTLVWGINLDGQADVPSDIVDAIAIDTGLNTVVLKADGTIATWGDNSYGQTDVPEGLGTITSIASGGLHTAVLKADGTVAAWGRNVEGQTDVPADLVNVKSIDTGGRHTVALKEDGTVVAWGWNANGQTDVPADLTNVKAISAGDLFTVALKEDGTVVAWGYNGQGQTDVPVDLPPVKAISAGGQFVAALLENGTVVVWGATGQWQSQIPAGLSNVTAIAAGAYHTVALKDDGTVVAWGKVWDGTGLVPVTVPDGLSNVIAIGAGGANSAALLPHITGIEVTSSPTKTAYYTGESLDLTGLVVKGNYSDGTEKILPVNLEDIGGFDSSVKATAQPVTVTINGKTATFNVDIVATNVKLVTSLTVSGTNNSIEVEINDSLQMTADAEPVQATDESVTWSVVNEPGQTGQATIDANGLLTGVAEGYVTVVATANDGSGIKGTLAVNVKVVPILVTSITITSPAAVTVNGTYEFSATVLPENATDKTVTWTVKNKGSKATIDPVTGVLNSGTKAGSITITATANDGSGVSDTVNLSITK